MTPLPRGQAGQDLFAFAVTGRLGAGTFLDVGSGDPIIFSNSYMLEGRGWRGLLVDRGDRNNATYRKTPFLQADALTIDWIAALAAHGLGPRVDYLSFDLDDDGAAALARLPWTTVRFSCMTVEHDFYRLGDQARGPMRELLLGHGYRLLCPDVVLDGFGIFEDWWVDPSVDSVLADSFATDTSTRWQDILTRGERALARGSGIKRAKDLTRTRYLDLLKSCLTRSAFDALTPEQLSKRMLGQDWPATAETMIGHARLDSIQRSAEVIFRDKIPGDFLEAGVWRGGACIFMRALIDHEPDRRVWVADSFDGLPPPNPEQYAQDAGDIHHTWRALAVSLDEVKRNFDRYDLLDDRVRFLKGWFKDTLPGPVERLALLRLDGDMYESTIQTLEALYDRVSPGGFVLVDDYGTCAGAKKATDNFRAARKIEVSLERVDFTEVWWRKPLTSGG